jgi:hypothetical protein
MKIERTSYVVYDRATGRILATHSRIDGESGKYLPLSDAEVFASCGVPFDDNTRARARILAVDAAALMSRKPLRVHPKGHDLVARDHLELKLSRTAIRGDGKDSVNIEIRVVDPDGKHNDSFSGRIKVSTQRGRLSADAGLVDVRNGSASVSLTSVPETLERVRVSARDLTGELETGTAVVEFT